jgi:hypothetical protein
VKVKPRKLFNLKAWLTIPDTAKHLSIMFGEEVTEADVLQLGLDGHLTLSVNIVGTIPAKSAKFVHYQEHTELVELANALEEKHGIKRERSKEELEEPTLQVGRDIEKLTDVWDLPMCGNERQDVERLYHALNDRSDLAPTYGDDGPLVGNSPDDMFLLYEIPEDGDEPVALRRLPKNTVFVVRTIELQRFEKSVAESPIAPSKPIGTTERNNLLIMIAALCDLASLDPTDRKTTTKIVQATQKIGVPISDDTIKRRLEEIPELIDQRMQ